MSVVSPQQSTSISRVRLHFTQSTAVSLTILFDTLRAVSGHPEQHFSVCVEEGKVQERAAQRTVFFHMAGVCVCAQHRAHVHTQWSQVSELPSNHLAVTRRTRHC